MLRYKVTKYKHENKLQQRKLTCQDLRVWQYLTETQQHGALEANWRWLITAVQLSKFKVCLLFSLHPNMILGLSSGAGAICKQ